MLIDLLSGVDCVNITNIKNYLHEKYGYQFDSDSMYERIDVWRNWWQGFYEPFHRYEERNGEKTILRQIFTMKMAKRVCEDWASILWTPDAEISFADPATSKYMLGDDETGESGLLDRLSFWSSVSSFLEDAFWSGTAVAVVHFKNAKFQGNKMVPFENSGVFVEYLPADYFIPLTVENGAVTEIAIVSEYVKDANLYAYLELHRKTEYGTYEIENRYFNIQNGRFDEAPPPDGVLQQYNTGSTDPLFATLSPNIKKNVSYGQGLGMSIFSDAIDQLQAVDLAFNNFCVDFKLGGKKVFYTQELIRYDSDGRPIAPDDIAQQLFIQLGDGAGLKDDQKPIIEYNPSLRVTENTDGVQKALDYLSFKTGLGTKHYQFDGGSVVTATQYHGDKQELVQHAAKHTTALDKALKTLLKAIMQTEKALKGAPIDPNTQITIKYSDNYIVDPDAQRERDRQDVRDGLMMPWEYRVKWYGDTEDDAKAILSNTNEIDPFKFNGGAE